jgi:predicted nucleic acid-binding protein
VSALFLDTSGWFAALQPGDAVHAPARERLQAAARSTARLVTTSLVIAEMHAMCVRRRSALAGDPFLNLALDSGAYEVIYPDQELILAARAQWLRRFADQSFSLCDAVSFEVMRRERITSALATDRHFAIAGFEILG